MGKLDKISADLPARVALAAKPLGIWASFRAGQRNVLELIPEAATRVPILSGTTGKRWHMLMDPDGLRQVLRDKVDESRATPAELLSAARCAVIVPANAWAAAHGLGFRVKDIALPWGRSFEIDLLLEPAP